MKQRKSSRGVIKDPGQDVVIVGWRIYELSSILRFILGISCRSLRGLTLGGARSRTGRARAAR